MSASRESELGFRLPTDPVTGSYNRRSRGRLQSCFHVPET